jgi:hypothetical protein
VSELVRDEQGFVLPVTIAVLAIALLLTSIAIISATGLTSAGTSDRRSKQAIAAADAGLQTAAYRLNSLEQTVDSLTALDPCVIPSLNVNGVATALQVNATFDPSAAGWCAKTSAEKIGNGASFQYQVTPTAAVAASLNVGSAPQVGLSLDRKVVATGTYTAPSGTTVTRRVLGDFTALDGTNLLNPTQGGYAVVATSAFAMTGGSVGLTTKHAGVLSGGTLTRSAGAICGNSVYSTTQAPAPTPNCSGVTIAQDAANAQAFTNALPTPAIPSGATVIHTPASCVALLGCSPASAATAGTVTINSVLSILPNIPAGTYLDVCQLNISAGELIGKGTSSNPSYIFIEPPSSCPGGTSGINVSGTGQFCQTTLSLVALCTSAIGLTDPRALQILASAGSTITFNNNVVGSFLPSYSAINAPNATVNVQGGSTLYGGIIGKTVNVAGSGSVQTSPTVTLNLGTLLALPLKLLPIYKLTSYTECTSSPTTASNPMSGC